MILKPLELEDMSIIIRERNKVPETLRTPFMLNSEMQKTWFENEICNRQSRSQFWGFWNNNTFVGYGGLENIFWQYRTAEIGLLIVEKWRGCGFGKKIFEMILDQGFHFLNLHVVWGECYYSGNVGFWEKLIKEHNAFSVDLPDRKFYNGKYYNSLYFSFVEGKSGTN